jgi:hypothetical protein
VGAELAWLETLLAAARAHPELLDDASIRFVDQMTLRVRMFGELVWLSPRQKGWLRSIEGQLAGAGAAIEHPQRQE